MEEENQFLEREAPYSSRRACSARGKCVRRGARACGAGHLIAGRGACVG